MIERRCLLLALPALTLAPHVARAGPSAQERKLANRLELWSSYSRRTRNLMARLSTRRETSLLEEPLQTTGTLVFREPATLVLRDDGRQGSTTLVEDDDIRIFLNGTKRDDPAATRPGSRPAARWLARRLLRLFAPGEGDDLLEDARTNVPKGRGYRLELMPPRGSAARRQVRALSLQLDPVTGAVIKLTIAEAQGDRITMGLSDHRQNLPPEDMAAFFKQLG